MLHFLHKVRPDKFFLFAGLVGGLLYLIYSPPFQSPDEYNHFYRTWQIANGDFVPEKQNNRLGGQIPLSFKNFMYPIYPASTDFDYKLTPEYITRGFNIECHPDTTEFIDFPNTSYYSPVSYAPQALAVFACRLFNSSVGTMYYGARLVVFLAWLFSVYFAIRIVPGAKWLFVVAGLLPMQLYLSVSLSADTVTNLLSFIWIALILKLSKEEKQINHKIIAWLVLLAVLLALAKIIYAALILLVFLIPQKNFGSLKKQVLVIVLIVLPAIIAGKWWSSIIMDNYLSFSTYHPDYRNGATLISGADYYQQKSFLSTHPLHYFKVLYTSLLTNTSFTLNSYVGNFGTFLGTPVAGWLTAAALVTLFISGFSNLQINVRQRIVLLVSFCATLILLVFSQYLTWCKVGIDGIDLLQGRYLVPLLPILALLVGSRRGVFYEAGMLAIPLSLFLNYSSLTQFYQRFWKEVHKNKLSITCNVEKSNSQGLLMSSNNSVFLPFKGKISSTEQCNGLQSVMLTNDSSEAFNYKLYNLQYGDRIYMEVSRKTDGNKFNRSKLVLYGKSDKGEEVLIEEFYGHYPEQNGWERMILRYALDKHFQTSTFEVKAVGGNSSSTYFDDFSLTIIRY